MNKTGFWITTLILCARSIPAAVVYGNAYVYPSEIVGSIDTGTGVIKQIAAVPGVSSANSGVSAFDPYKPAYYFCGLDAALTNRLYSVNIRDGTTTMSGPLATAPAAMQFDPMTRALYGTVYDFPNQTVIVGRIDPATGAVTKVATVATQSPGSANGISAFDALRRRYYLYAGTPSGTYLFAVNVDNGTVTASSEIVEIPWAMQFDPLSRTLYGTTLAGPYPNVAVGVGKIDAGTGIITPVASVATGAAGSPQGISAFDPLTRNYYLYVQFVSEGLKLYAFNVRTGTVTASTPVTVSPTAIESGRR
jgi:hypothetical protein